MTQVARAGSTLIPLYLQISESISREIAAGRFAPGDRLPPERELAKQFTTTCLLYTSPSPRDGLLSRMPSSA